MKTSLISFLVCSFLIFGAQAVEVGDTGRTTYLCEDLAAAVDVATAATKSDELGTAVAKQHVVDGDCGSGPPVPATLEKEFKVTDKYSVWKIVWAESDLYIIATPSKGK